MTARHSHSAHQSKNGRVDLLHNLLHILLESGVQRLATWPPCGLTLSFNYSDLSGMLFPRPA